MIELCNEAQKDMWINIPALATPQFVQSLAQLIAAKLDPNLNVYVEYGNEDWNGGFSAYGQIATAAQANPLLNQSLGQYQLVAQQTRLHAGDRRPDLRPGLRGRAGLAGAADPGRPGVLDAVPDLRAAVHPAAVRRRRRSTSTRWPSPPISAIDGDDHVPGLTLDQLFADMNQLLQHDIRPVDHGQRRAGEAIRRAAGGLRGRPGAGAGTGNGPNFSRDAAGTERPAHVPALYSR